MPNRTVRTHGISGYRAGCRCVTCTLAESERKRNYRATGSGAKADVPLIRPVTTGTPTTSARRQARGQELPSVGELEAVVIAECESLAVPPDYAPEVVGARRMAAILDREDLQGLHIKASVELARVMDTLRKRNGPQRKSKGRLAKVQQLQLRRIN